MDGPVGPVIARTIYGMTPSLVPGPLAKRAVKDR